MSNNFLSRKSIWNVFCKSAALLFRPQCVKLQYLHYALDGLLEAIAIPAISLKLISNSDILKSNLPITSISISQSFWNFAQSMAVSLPCSVQNFKMIGQLRNNVWASRFQEIWVLVSFPWGLSNIVTAPSFSQGTDTLWSLMLTAVSSESGLAWGPCGE